jgi:hypothetical protein
MASLRACLAPIIWDWNYLFMILSITCLAAIELVMEFILNSMVFHLMPNLNSYWVPYHFCGFFKMKWYLSNEMKWNEMKWWVPNKPLYLKPEEFSLSLSSLSLSSQHTSPDPTHNPLHATARTRRFLRSRTRKLASDLIAPLPPRRPFWHRGREGSPGFRLCVCLSCRVSRFSSFLCQRYGGADVDGASWNNGLWYVSNVSIIFYAPCLFLHHLPTVSLHFVALLCIFRN